MSSSSSQTTLTSLPFELQLQIFRDYFKIDGGYVFNGDSEKLTANGKPIDLALMYTCRSIAHSTKHMPLSLNTIHFSTLYRSDWMPLAGCFDYVTIFYPLLAADMLVRLEPFITPKMYSQLGLEYPAFTSRLQELSRIHQEDLDRVEPGGPDTVLRGERSGKASDWTDQFRGDPDQYLGIRHQDTHCDLAASTRRCVRATQETTFYFLRLLAESQPIEFSKLVYETLPHWVDTHPAHEFLDLGFNLWDIPSRSELEHVSSRLNVDDAWQIVDPWYYRPQHSYKSGTYDPLHKGTRCREKIRFSAAAAAIRFLTKRLLVDQRRQIRNVILHEDFLAAGNPSSHAQGLAPFFRENPQLRVERRVSVIRCISEGRRLERDIPSHVVWFLQEPSHPHLRGYREYRESMLSAGFSEVIAQWLLDALAVPDAGIPAESFTFVLEGGPDPDFSTNLFQQIIHRDIAWHKAYRASIERGLLVRWPLLLGDTLVSDGFPEAMDHLMNRTSLLHSDFNLGHQWNWEDMIEKESGVTTWKWYSEFHYRDPLRTTFPPALDYASILADNYDIQTEDEYC
ncbi:hypothetical protein EDB81DRAFT_678899 [Dactylonectria macrodidyma]|uniref:Uncharacterized protein n=1 Tax=Dactylonectria macrodidyma TaxID=307937 RepID=A0A9P9JJA3_9HYPO|nr:hypothetical protein EDB81DRAFT_678899 [Dactylonectria macrodidyma]